MARESAAARVARAGEILERLEEAYPDAHCALDHGDPYQLLVATILSAQCTDARVNLVTPAFFARFPDAGALAAGTQDEVEALIRSTGFFRNKGKNLLAMATALMERHGGQVPETMDELRALPGVGRKTANVMLGNAFGRNDGVTVDTHVGRIARLLRLTTATDPEKVEQRSDGPVPAAQMDAPVAPAHQPRPRGLHRPPPPVRHLPGGGTMPQRQAKRP